MSVSLGPIQQTGSFFSTASVSPMPKASTPEVQKIDGQLNSSGRRAIGDNAVQASMQRLQKLFAEKNVNVTMDFDSRTGSSLRITDGDTGKTIVEMPPSAAVAMAQKAVQQQTGWMMDRSA